MRPENDKTALEMPFGGHADSCGPKEPRIRCGAHWRNLANRTERFSGLTPPIHRTVYRYF